jgi:MFS family permease
VLLVSGTVVTYVLLYMTTFALVTLKLGPSVAFGVGAINAVAIIIFSTLGGVLSDRAGRRPVIILSAIVAGLIAWPFFSAIVHSPGAASLFIGMAVISIFTNMAAAPVIVALTEGLPPAIRSGGVAIVYAFAISVFGGATQFVLAKAIHASGNPMTPAWFLIGAVVLSIPAAWFMRESAPAKVGA